MRLRKFGFYYKKIHLVWNIKPHVIAMRRKFLSKQISHCFSSYLAKRTDYCDCEQGTYKVNINLLVEQADLQQQRQHTVVSRATCNSNYVSEQHVSSRNEKRQTALEQWARHGETHNNNNLCINSSAKAQQLKVAQRQQQNRSNRKKCQTEH